MSAPVATSNLLTEFPIRWNIADGYPAPGIEKHGSKVFTTFACGGGSSMGYKLAGYEVVAANDIDKDMRKVYEANHRPKEFFMCAVKDLLENGQANHLAGIDVLDGSPPCSVFSMAGSRESAWGKEKMFREGQLVQVLDDLFMDFVNLAKKLQPKVVIGENVKGMVAGKAKGYVIEVINRLDDAGYDTQLFLLNSAFMGVPQRRERVFFLSRRKDLQLPPIKIKFSGEPFTLAEVARLAKNQFGKPLSEAFAKHWRKMHNMTGSLAKAHPTGSFFNSTKCSPFMPCQTITSSSGAKLCHWSQPNELSDEMLAMCGTFPLDFDYMGEEAKYVIGMSVPPVMMAQVARQVYLQWLSRKAT